MHVSFSSVGFFTASLAGLATLAVSAKTDNVKHLAARDAPSWFPQFTMPSAGDMYEVGEKHVASWDPVAPIGHDTSEVPQHADLMLGHNGDDDGGLVTLVKNVALFEDGGLVDYTLPDDLPTRDNYYLLLLTSTVASKSSEFTISTGDPDNYDEDLYWDWPLLNPDDVDDDIDIDDDVSEGDPNNYDGDIIFNWAREGSAANAAGDSPEPKFVKKRSAGGRKLRFSK
ncbi:hypothetical protein JCM11491_000811 [Sporobolomyces phaffii]